jgi:hypothetical protein
VAEQTYDADHSISCRPAIGKLLRNGRVVGYLAKNY